MAAIEKLAAHGMNMAVLFREPSTTAKKAIADFAKIAADNEVSILPFNLNVLETASRQTFIEKFNTPDKKGKVKLLLHSVARGNLKPLITDKETAVLSAEDIQLTTYAMSNSLLDWTRDLLAVELFHTDGRIIGLTSEGANKHWDAYAAVAIAKAALQSLTTYMAVEFAPYGLKTNLIQAGITNTAALQKIPGSEKLIEIAKTRNPMKRMTVPQDVANVIYLLCTDEAYWINGALLHADGGEHCL